MKLAFKIVNGILGTAVVAGGVTAFVLVNKTEEKNGTLPNNKMFEVPGFTQKDLDTIKAAAATTKAHNDAIAKLVLKDANAITKFETLLTDLGFNATNDYKTLNMTKLIQAFGKSGVKHSNPIDRYGTSAKEMSGTYGPYFLASFGNKYQDLDKLIASLIALTKKPTYKEFIELFSTKYSLRDHANKIMKYSFGEHPKTWFVSPTPKHTTTTHTGPSSSPAGTLATTPQDISQNANTAPTQTITNLRVGVWNLLNYNTDIGETKKDVQFKTRSFARIIIDAQLDVIGLTEVEGENSLKALAQELNKQAGDPTNSFYKYIRSAEAGAFADGTLVGSAGQYEYYGFVFDSRKTRPVNFDKTSSIGAIYENPKLDNELINGQKTGYVRPPFAVKFEDKNHHDVTVAVGHLDSPGHTNDIKGNIHEETYKGGQGTQEVWEAAHLVDVMNYFDSIDGDNDDLIFLGDTNIKMDMKGTYTPFQPLIDSGFKEMLDPKLPASKTSLGVGKTDTDYHYSQPYDRIFVKSDMLPPAEVETKYDILSPTNRRKLFDYSQDQGYIDQKYITRANELSLNGIRYKISDHTMGYINLDLSKTDADTANPQTWTQYLALPPDYKLVPKSATTSGTHATTPTSGSGSTTTPTSGSGSSTTTPKALPATQPITQITFAQLKAKAASSTQGELSAYLLSIGATPETVYHSIEYGPFGLSMHQMVLIKKSIATATDWSEFANKFPELGYKYAGDNKYDGVFTGTVGLKINEITTLLSDYNPSVVHVIQHTSSIKFPVSAAQIAAAVADPAKYAALEAELETQTGFSKTYLGTSGRFYPGLQNVAAGDTKQQIFQKIFDAAQAYIAAASSRHSTAGIKSASTATLDANGHVSASANGISASYITRYNKLLDLIS